MSRLRILSNEDYAKLYELPKLTEEEKSHLFVFLCFSLEAEFQIFFRQNFGNIRVILLQLMLLWKKIQFKVPRAEVE